MSKKDAIQPLRIRPLTGSFDSRSLPELVANNAWRMLQNTRTRERGRLCRIPGWEKFLAGIATNRAYNNEDLHDQLLSLQTYYDTINDVDSSDVVAYPPNNATFGDFCGTTKKTRPQGKQPITFSAEITSSRGTRHALVGTQSRLYSLSFGSGNWKIIADGLGGTAVNPGVRFQHAALGDYVFFTNNFDEPFYWKIGQPTFGCAMQSVQNIPELQEIGVTKVGCMASYKGTLFMANVEQDGERFVNRILWSGYQSPLNVVEDPGVSTAGTQDLDFGEQVIAMKELGDFLYIYTDRAIWLAVVTDGDATFAFVRKYKADKKGDKALLYPHTLVGSGNSHFYGSNDGIYEWNPYIMEPAQPEWIHQSSNVLYDNLNKTACAAHTAGFDTNNNEIWFSFAQGTSTVPNVTLTCNTNFGQCSKIDHGFTSFFMFTPDTRETVRDWLLHNCIANEACLADPEILALGFSEPKEGPGVPQTNPVCTALIQHVYTGVAKNYEDGIVAEDLDQPEPSSDSLCASLGDMTLAEACGDCDLSAQFVGASALDWCLKTIGTIYARERYVAASNSYVLDGYDTILLKGPLEFGTDHKKILTSDSEGGSVKLEFDPEPQTIPSMMKLRVGCAHRAIDPLKANCGISWYDEEERPISCVDDDRSMEWAAYAVDRVIYLEFKISGTGGASCYSSLQVKVANGGC